MPTLVTKRPYYLKLILLIILGLPLTAFAQQTVQFDFSGIFYSNNSPTVLGVPVAGQVFTGTMSYDSSQTPQNSVFYYVPSQYNISFNINGNTIISDGFMIRDIPNSMLRFDSGSSVYPSATLSVNGAQVQDQTAGFYFVFFADSQNTFTSLPTSISNAGYGYLYANNYQNSDGFTITSINAVPEPSEYMLMLMGFGMTCLFAVRRKFPPIK